MTSNVPARKSSGRTPGLDEPVAVRESEGRPVGLLAKTRVALCHQREEASLGEVGLHLPRASAREVGACPDLRSQLREVSEEGLQGGRGKEGRGVQWLTPQQGASANVLRFLAGCRRVKKNTKLGAATKHHAAH